MCVCVVLSVRAALSTYNVRSNNKNEWKRSIAQLHCVYVFVYGAYKSVCESGLFRCKLLQCQHDSITAIFRSIVSFISFVRSIPHSVVEFIFVPICIALLFLVSYSVRTQRPSYKTFVWSGGRIFIMNI